MNPIKTKTVAEIVTENFLAVNVLQKHGIDLFNFETKTLAEACQQQALNLTVIEQEIRETEGIRTHHYDRWELDYLIDYILNNHHYFVWVNLPVIKEYALKVARTNGHKFPETIEVNQLFKEFATELETHLDQQEHKIFPYIKQLVYAQKDGTPILHEDLQLSVDSMKAEYRYFAAKINRIVSLMGRVEIANWPETTAAVLLYKLRAFKQDFYQHIHLEKNILFPKALKLEQKLGAQGYQGMRV